jgi:hypothetical protein
MPLPGVRHGAVEGPCDYYKLLAEVPGDQAFWTKPHPSSWTREHVL